MKNKGFTLSEVLITLVIIGVVTALVLPAANSLKPDETKMKFLKVYDSLSENIKEMANNSKLFPACTTPVNNVMTCIPKYPLFNTEGTQGTIGVNGGNGKLCRLLSLQYTGAVSNRCSDNYAAFSQNNRSFSFTADTGEDIYVTAEPGTESTKIQIVFDVNGNGNGTNCIYNQNNCPRPDTFILWVNGKGDVFPGDRVAEYYLKTRKNTKAKKPDITNHNNATLDNANNYTINQNDVEVINQ